MVAVLVGAGGDRLLQRLQMRLHVLDARLLAQRRLHPLGDVVRLADGDVGGELEVQRDADLAVVLVDRDVVRLADQRLGERDRERAVAQVQAVAPRLEVHDHVAVGQRVADGGLDGVGGAVALDDRLPRRHADDGVGEVLAAGLAHAQPAQLDAVAEAVDGLLGRACASAGAVSISTRAFS